MADEVLILVLSGKRFPRHKYENDDPQTLVDAHHSCPGLS